MPSDDVGKRCRAVDVHVSAAPGDGLAWFHLPALQCAVEAMCGSFIPCPLRAMIALMTQRLAQTPINHTH